MLLLDGRVIRQMDVLGVRGGVRRSFKHKNMAAFREMSFSLHSAPRWLKPCPLGWWWFFFYFFHKKKKKEKEGGLTANYTHYSNPQTTRYTSEMIKALETRSFVLSLAAASIISSSLLSNWYLTTIKSFSIFYLFIIIKLRVENSNRNELTRDACNDDHSFARMCIRTHPSLN